MKAKLFGTDGKQSGEAKLPDVFSTPHRPEIIRRAVHAEQSWARQSYGANVLAGKRSSAHYHGMRHYVFTMMNRELARLPRIHGKSAHHMNLRVRRVAQAVKGIKAHPPRAEKNWEKKINRKEMLLARKSAIAASADAELLRKRGHFFSESPLIVQGGMEDISKTADAIKVLEALGLSGELKRCRRKKVRAGVGKRRGRKYREKKGPAIIVSRECAALKAFSKIPGIDVCAMDALTTEVLAPGAQAGRLLLITEPALERMKKL